MSETPQHIIDYRARRAALEPLLNAHLAVHPLIPMTVEEHAAAYDGISDPSITVEQLCEMWVLNEKRMFCHPLYEAFLKIWDDSHYILTDVVFENPFFQTFKRVLDNRAIRRRYGEVLMQHIEHLK